MYIVAWFASEWNGIWLLLGWFVFIAMCTHEKGTCQHACCTEMDWRFCGRLVGDQSELC